MIRVGNNKINKVGGSNKLYFDNGVIYQSYNFISSVVPDVPDTPEGEFSLPDVPFFFNYNAKNYEDGTLFNVAGAIYDENITLSNNITRFEPNYLYNDNNAYFSNWFDSNSENPFNRSGNDPITIIVKTHSDQQYGTTHIFSNRGKSYNYMVRNTNQYAFLHTSNGTDSNGISVLLDYSQPNIYAFRCNSEGKGYAENYTTGIKGTERDTNWGDASDGFGMFCGGYTFERERYQGKFYWIYASPEELTDEQILQVISYNEGELFEPIVPEEPEEPEDEVLEIEFTNAKKLGGNEDMYINLYNENKSVQVCLNLFGLSTSNNNENYIPQNDYYVGYNRGNGYVYGGGYSWIKIDNVQTNITENVNTYVTVEHIDTNYKLTFNGISFGNILLDGLTFYGPIEGLIIP